METISLILYILLGVCFISLIYTVYQFSRNNAVYSIRIKWLDDGDRRFFKYTYNEMFNPSKDNMFGLKLPKDVDFK